MPAVAIFASLAVLGGSLLFSHSAYAAFSASISRSGTVTLAEAGGSTIKPSSAGTLGTGSDTVSVTTNCSAGYNLYVSATSSGGTSLKLSGASDPSAAVNTIPTSSTAAGSETTLSKDTWGVGKTTDAFSGLQPYSNDAGTFTPLYTGTSSGDYDFYYGVNVSTAKTPGSYTGEVLYTVVMNDACLKYTLKFDGNGATTNNLPSGTTGHEYPTPRFGSTVDLSQYSGTDMIARTGYTLSGWKISGGDGTLLPTNSNTVLDDGESTELTLVAQWTANTYTIQYNKGSDTSVSGTAPTSQTSQAYGNNVTLRANTLSKTGYNFSGWSRTNSSTSSGAKHYNASTSYAVSTLASDFGVANTNGATMNLYPRFVANTYTIQYNKGSDTSVSGTAPTSQTSQAYGSNVTLRTNTLSKTGYHFTGWSRTNSSTSSGTKHYNASTSYAVSTLASDFSVANTNGATMNLYPVFVANTYTITYAAGSTGGSCSVTSTSATYNQNVTLSSTKCTKSGYEQKGWSTSSSASNTKTYDMGQTLTKPNFTTTNGGTYTLYPYFESAVPIDDGNKGNMQSFSCTSVTSGHTATVTDSRDSHSYKIYRIPTDQTYVGIGSSKVANIAGKCLMTEDLMLGYNETSNLSLNTTYSAGSGTIKYVNSANNGTGWSATNSDSNLQYTYGTGTYNSRSYYSYGAAQKVCPKGWRLPTSDEYADSKESSTYNAPTKGLAAIVGNSIDGSTALSNTPWNFTFGGRFYTSGWLAQGSGGFYWSSQSQSTGYGYSLSFNLSSVNNVKRDQTGMCSGLLVRCIAD